MWLEVKLLQTWINTAMLAVFALFTYPFALIITCLQLTLLFARPIFNVNKETTARYLLHATFGTLWVVSLSIIFVLLLFGNVVSQGSLGEWLANGESFVTQQIMSFHCVGHRLWLFLCLGVLPSSVSLVKVVLS